MMVTVLVIFVLGGIVGSIITAHLIKRAVWVEYTFNNDMPQRGLILIQTTSGNLYCVRSKKEAEQRNVIRYMVIR